MTFLPRLRLAMACLVLLAAVLPARAGSIDPLGATLAPGEQGLALAASFAIDLGPQLEEAVGSGVPLNFRLEFDLTRKRWYWADEHIAGRVLKYRLSYQALTRQYRLSLAGLHQNFGTLAEALHALGRVAQLHVVDAKSLRPGETYHAAVRLSLDHSYLPKPLQVDSIADPDWRVEAKTLRWDFVQPRP